MQPTDPIQEIPIKSNVPKGKTGLINRGNSKTQSAQNKNASPKKKASPKKTSSALKKDPNASRPSDKSQVQGSDTTQNNSKAQ